MYFQYNLCIKYFLADILNLISLKYCFDKIIKFKYLLKHMFSRQSHNLKKSHVTLYSCWSILIGRDLGQIVGQMCGWDLIGNEWVMHVRSHLIGLCFSSYCGYQCKYLG